MTRKPAKRQETPTSMPRKLELTWHKPRRCWKKKRQGKTYYVGVGKCAGKTDAAGYYAALDEWKQTEAELAKAERELEDKQLARREEESRESFKAMLDGVSEARFELDDRMRRMERDYPIASLGGDVGLPEDDPEYPTRENMERTEFGRVAMGAMHDMLEEEVKDLDSPLIADMIREFVESHERRADAKLIAVSTAKQYGDSTRIFGKWCEEQKLKRVTQLQASVFARYQQHVMQKMGQGTKARTARDHLLKAKQFAEWLYKHEHLEQMPRTVTRNYATIKQSRPTPRHWEVKELRRIWKAASDEVKLYMALALNCGYLPSDIGTLRSEHLDLKKGVINRERHKSGNPQVHRLWPETLELIEKHRKDTPEDSLLFRSPTGLALWRDGNGDKLISKRFKEACLLAKVKLNGRNFRHLRATGANLIEQANAESPQLASQYLAHSVGGVKKHYTLPAFEPMFRALDGLREELGFAVR
ncbi:MAG: hypothetical protein Tsb0013_07510 [Phycisphaerales bacterium]